MKPTAHFFFVCFDFKKNKFIFDYAYQELEVSETLKNERSATFTHTTIPCIKKTKSIHKKKEDLFSLSKEEVGYRAMFCVSVMQIN